MSPEEYTGFGNVPTRRFVDRYMVQIRVWGAVLVLGGCVWGCNAVPLTASLWSEAERREEAASYFNQGVRAQTDGDGEQADRLLDLAVLLHDDDGEGAFYVAKRLLDAVKPDTAVLLLEKATQEPGQGNNPLLYGVLARAYTMHGQEKDTVEHCRKKAEELVRAAQALLGKPAAPSQQDREGNVRLMLSAGRYCSEFEGDTDSAIVLLRGAVALGDPNQPTRVDARARSFLGLTLALNPGAAKGADEASDLTRQAAQYDLMNPDLLLAHGVALLHEGDFSGAQRVLREATDLDPNNAELHYLLGKAYARQQLFAQAALELDRALILRPRYDQAVQERKRLPKPVPAPASASEEDFY